MAFQKLLLLICFVHMVPPNYLIFGEEQVFLTSVMQYIHKRLGIKTKTISPYNHGSVNKKTCENNK